MISFALDTPQLAGDYDVVGRRQYEHGQLLIADLAVRSGQRVLDVGCGTGMLAAHVAALVGPDGSVDGLDPLPLRVQLAQRRRRANLRLGVGKVEDLSRFARNSFDVVYLNSVMHWLENKGAALAEIQRVLRPGGKLGFTIATQERPHSFEAVRGRAFERAGLGSGAELEPGTPHRLTRKQARELFAASGFRELQLVIRSFTDRFDSVDDVLAFNRASSFGNHLAGLRVEQLQRLRDALAIELEPHRDACGIRQERHLIFAVAEKLADH